MRGENRQVSPSCSAPFLAHVHMCDTQTHIHTHAHKCTHIGTRAQADTHKNICMHTQAHTCTSNTQAHVHKHTQAQIHAEAMHKHACKNTYVHKYTDAHMHILGVGLQLSSRALLGALLRLEVWAGPPVY